MTIFLFGPDLNPKFLLSPNTVISSPTYLITMFLSFLNTKVFESVYIPALLFSVAYTIEERQKLKSILLFVDNFEVILYCKN